MAKFLSSFAFKKCKHPNYEYIYQINASSLFPDINLLGKQVTVAGLSIKRCLDCGTFHWTEGNEELKPIVQEQIMSFLKASDDFLDQSLIFGDFKKANLQVIEPPTSFKKVLAEEAVFTISSTNINLVDVILPHNTEQGIKQIFASIKYQHIVNDEWGFNKVDPVGTGTVILFYGPSGTGKTRSAGAIANELDMPMISVSLKDLESRFMGQTPKNIAKAFEEANKQNAVLFFDEADTVLGKRLSSVTTGVDNEINMERSTLLKELEAFSGICIFATNFQENIDTAFQRRINYHVSFELPDPITRKRLLSYFLIDSIPLLETKEHITDQIVEETSEFSGGDIVQALRQGFIIALMENPTTPKVSLAHFIEGIANLKKIKQAIAQRMTQTIFNIKNKQ